MSTSSQTKPRETKIATVQRLLGRKSGADIGALQKATGWQAHSVRAALSGLRKAGCQIEKHPSPKEGGAPIYRLAKQDTAQA